MTRKAFRALSLGYPSGREKFRPVLLAIVEGDRMAGVARAFRRGQHRGRVEPLESRTTAGRPSPGARGPLRSRSSTMTVS